VIVGVPLSVSVYVKVAVLDPSAIDSGLAGVKVAVPVELLDSATLIVASAVFALPNESRRCTVIVEDAAPAVVVTGAEVNTSLLAAAGVTVSCWVASVSPAVCAVIVGVPLKVSV
jgi:hypothetical protein